MTFEATVDTNARKSGFFIRVVGMVGFAIWIYDVVIHYWQAEFSFLLYIRYIHKIVWMYLFTYLYAR